MSSMHKNLVLIPKTKRERKKKEGIKEGRKKGKELREKGKKIGRKGRSKEERMLY